MIGASRGGGDTWSCDRHAAVIIAAGSLLIFPIVVSALPGGWSPADSALNGTQWLCNYACINASEASCLRQCTETASPALQHIIPGSAVFVANGPSVLGAGTRATGGAEAWTLLGGRVLLLPQSLRDRSNHSSRPAALSACTSGGPALVWNLTWGAATLGYGATSLQCASSMGAACQGCSRLRPVCEEGLVSSECTRLQELRNIESNAQAVRVCVRVMAWAAFVGLFVFLAPLGSACSEGHCLEWIVEHPREAKLYALRMLALVSLVCVASGAAVVYFSDAALSILSSHTTRDDNDSQAQRPLMRFTFDQQRASISAAMFSRHVVLCFVNIGGAASVFLFYFLSSCRLRLCIRGRSLSPTKHGGDGGHGAGVGVAVVSKTAGTSTQSAITSI